MKLIINIAAKIVCLSILFGVLAAPLATVPVAASDQSDICAGLTQTGGSCGSGAGTINHVLANIANIISVIAGIAAVIMIIIGGVKYITSNGESSNLSSAKNTIIFAIIGLVIVAVAQSIVHFVLGKV